MDAEKSEKMFSTYLELYSMNFERDFKVYGNRNVDFKITTNDCTVLCDVKEVHNSRIDVVGKIDAYTHIREDLKNMRKKFGNNRPMFPVVLVTMNFSNNFFTALTVVQAMYGDIGVNNLYKEGEEIHHMPRGNASMTKTTHTSISGILVFDCEYGKHKYFSNEFAKLRLPSGYFPEITEFSITRSAGEQELVQLSRYMFWECEKQ